MRNLNRQASSRQPHRWLAVALVGLCAVFAGCEESSARALTVPPPAQQAGEDSSAAVLSVQPVAQCPYTPKPQPATGCGNCPAEAAPLSATATATAATVVAADSPLATCPMGAKAETCPKPADGCPPTAAGHADCAECKPEVTAASAEARNADGQLIGLPPVACDAGDGSCAAPAIATATAPPPIIVNPNIDGTGDVPSPCCPAEKVSAASTVTAATAATPPVEIAPPQAAPVINRSDNGCAACDGR